MYKYLVLLFIPFVFAQVSCKQSNVEGQEQTGRTSGELIFPLNIQKGGSYQSVDQIRAQALTIIDHRIQTDGEPMAMLTFAYWWPEFVFDGSQMSDIGQYDGYWLKFNEDFTYRYGRDDRIFGNGKYHFTLDSNALIMLDTDIESEPKVWTANYNGRAMALVGTHEYGVNNGMQIKLVALDEEPL